MERYECYAQMRRPSRTVTTGGDEATRYNSSKAAARSRRCSRYLHARPRVATISRVIIAIVSLAALCLPPGGAGAASPPSVASPARVQNSVAQAAAEFLVLRREQRWPLLRQWLAGAGVPAEPTQTPALSTVELVTLGERLYGMYCRNCHGSTGRGDGPRAPVLDPAPRDFTSGTFKFRSTPSGLPPTDEDLFRTISGGLRGTGMLPFADLPEEQRWALVAYVRKLADDETIEPDGDPLDVPEPPADLSSPMRIARGAAAYERLGCAKCHGSEGRGDGESAPTLVDAWGRPAAPRDLVAHPLKRGDTPEDVFRSLITGLDGSPMPGYRDAASDADVWDLVAFIESLQTTASRDIPAAVLASARASVVAQQRQGAHTVIGGCGCQARRLR